MIHTGRHFRIYRKRTHLFFAFVVIILPLLFIFLVGRISHISSLALISSLGLSLYRLIIAYFLSLVLAVILASFFGHGRLGNFFVPVFDIFQNLPSFALIPVFIILFGNTNEMAIIFAASSMVWPLLFNMLGAIHNVRVDLTEAAEIFGAIGWRKIWYFYLPLSFPALITGSMVAVSIGWEAIIGIEIISLANGIGTFLNSASDKLILAFGIIALLLVVYAINKLIWTPLIKKTQIYAE